MRRILLTVLFLSSLTSLGLSSPLCDIGIPAWRGLSGSTYGIWTFDDSSRNPAMVGENLYGTTELTVIPAPGDNWRSDFDGALGVWPLCGQIIIEIPNTPYDPTKNKIIQIQLLWEGKTINDIPSVEIIDNNNRKESLIPNEVINTGTNWVYNKYIVTWPYNPNHETINIGGAIYVDCLVVDTICIPEPATFAVMGLGALFLLFTKNRQIA